MNDNNVSLTISNEIVTPIVKEKINLMVLEALGGKDQLVSQIVDNICRQKVDASGKVSNYSSDNKYSWLDIAVTKQIKEVIAEEVRNEITKGAKEIKDQVIKLLQTKKGQSTVASALVDSLTGTFVNDWRSKFDIQFYQEKRY